MAVPRKYKAWFYTHHYDDWYEGSRIVEVGPWASADEVIQATKAAGMNLGHPDDLTVERPSGFAKYCEFFIKHHGSPSVRLTPEKETT